MQKIKLPFRPLENVEVNKWPIQFIWWSRLDKRIYIHVPGARRTGLIMRRVWQLFPLGISKLAYAKRCGAIPEFLVAYADGTKLYLKPRTHVELILKDLDNAGYDTVCFGGHFESFASLLCPFLFEIEPQPALNSECFLEYPASIVDTEQLREVADLLRAVATPGYPRWEEIAHLFIQKVAEEAKIVAEKAVVQMQKIYTR